MGWISIPFATIWHADMINKPIENPGNKHELDMATQSMVLILGETNLDWEELSNISKIKNQKQFCMFARKPLIKLQSFNPELVDAEKILSAGMSPQTIIDFLDQENDLIELARTISESTKLFANNKNRNTINYLILNEQHPEQHPNDLCKNLLNSFRINLPKHVKIQKINFIKTNSGFTHHEVTQQDSRYSVSAIIACYKDSMAIPVMYKRLKEIFEKLNIDHEIIFVNDCSPDDSEEVIRKISSSDPTVVGITHSRNFGSQSAFKSGMAMASKQSCVLMDGDLQDPPELIEAFVEKWKEGYDVIYGRRVKREATFFMQISYKLFYRVFDYFSYLPIPKDAGDFSLITRRVVEKILSFPERDAFLRGIRAYVGFKQTGVDYVRPERMFGVTTNNFLKNIDWAKKGIFSFSNKPLNFLSFLGFTLFPLSLLLAFTQVTLKLFFPSIAPPGFTSTITIVIFFGALNVFGIGILGEYLAKIFEEVKQRPSYIRNKITRNGITFPDDQIQ